MSEQPSSTATGRLRARTAEEIRVLLARRRMSGSELARRTGLKQPYLSRRMTGEIAFDLDDLEVIAAALGVTVQDLIASGNPGAQTTPPKVAQPVRPAPRQPKGGTSKSVASPTLRRPAKVSSASPVPAQLSGSHDRAA